MTPTNPAHAEFIQVSQTEALRVLRSWQEGAQHLRDMGAERGAEMSEARGKELRRLLGMSEHPMRSYKSSYFFPRKNGLGPIFVAHRTDANAKISGDEIPAPNEIVMIDGREHTVVAARPIYDSQLNYWPEIVILVIHVKP